MNHQGLRVITIVALATAPIGAGCASKHSWAPALAGTASPRNSIVAEADVPATPHPPAQPRVASAPAAQAPAAPVAPAPAPEAARVALAPAAQTPAAPVAPAPAPEARIGLPPVRDYQPISELRDVYFDFGKAAIRPSDARILDANAAWLRANPNQLLLIEGHCDTRGLVRSKNEWNMALGEERARAAMNYLVAHGVQPGRITILSYGEERPLCTEPSERCWSQNRRSRFLVKPR